jgi:uncharacterized protein YoaH (UPF0181 family)
MPARGHASAQKADAQIHELIASEARSSGESKRRRIAVLRKNPVNIPRSANAPGLPFHAMFATRGDIHAASNFTA